MKQKTRFYIVTAFSVFLWFVLLVISPASIIAAYFDGDIIRLLVGIVFTAGIYFLTGILFTLIKGWNIEC